MDAEVLNMWCAEGCGVVKLTDIQPLRFANPVIESEFRRALEDPGPLPRHPEEGGAVCTSRARASARCRSAMSIEAPIWKTSYRLVLDEKEKPYLQGWAMVENPTDEDWARRQDGTWSSGRPICFKMDLYNPLYINRPIVEPELFASLRPVTYRGGFGNGRLAARAGRKSRAMVRHSNRHARRGSGRPAG